MGLSSFVKRFDKRKHHGPSAPEAAKKETPANGEGEEGDQAAEEACRRGSFSDPALIHVRCVTHEIAMLCDSKTLIGSLRATRAHLDVQTAAGL
jgi:hypothetical protein